MVNLHSENGELQLVNLDLNLLRVFLVLMQQRSVTRSAEKMGKTQSAISHSLAKLREYFGDELFTRDSGSMEPTVRAKDLALVISAALMNIGDAIEREVRFNAATTQRTFRIGINDNLAATYVPGLTREIVSQAPNATLNVMHVHESQVSKLIRAREIDYAIIAANDVVDTRLEMVTLSMDQLICLGWKGNPMLDKPISLDDYVQSLHLQVSADGQSRGAADRVLQARNLKRRVVATVPHYLVAPSIIKGTNLLSILGESILFSLSRESELVVVGLPFKMPKLRICLVYDPLQQIDEAHDWLRDLIKGIWKAQQVKKKDLLLHYTTV